MIASELLRVSVNTVKTQVKSILRKLRVRSRWEVGRALETGQTGPV
jgi:DNA-binding NarL/FixJ family response regulator